MDCENIEKDEDREKIINKNIENSTYETDALVELLMLSALILLVREHTDSLTTDTIISYGNFVSFVEKPRKPCICNV